MKPDRELSPDEVDAVYGHVNARAKGVGEPPYFSDPAAAEVAALLPGALCDLARADPYFAQRMKIMEKPFSVLTEFRENSNIAGVFLEERIENCSEDCIEDYGVEPELFAANVPNIENSQILLALDKEVHVERFGGENSQDVTLIHTDKDVLAAAIKGLGLRASEIKPDGGNEVVQFIVPRLSADDELVAIGRGHRIGRSFLGLPLEPAG